MRLKSITLRGFRCFGDQAVTIDFEDLTAFVGINGSGKTAVLMALARMFGTPASLRVLTKEDFHLAPQLKDPETLDMELEVQLEFPDLMDDDAACSSTAVPECLRHILANDQEESVPVCRVRLNARWTKSPAPEGEIETALQWVGSLEDPPPTEALHSLHGPERSSIQVFYIPAARDAVRELRAVSGTILSRVLRHISWSEDIKESLKSLSDNMSQTLRTEQSFAGLEAALRREWKDLRGGRVGKPELWPADTDLGALLRRIDPQLVRSESARQPMGLLSEGERSLMYFALLASALQFESNYLASG